MRKNAAERRSAGFRSPVACFVAISREMSAMLRDPVTAYTVPMAKSTMVEATLPRMRYLKPASSSSASMPNGTSAYDAMDAISRNTNMLKMSAVTTSPFIPVIMSMKSA